MFFSIVTYFQDKCMNKKASVFCLHNSVVFRGMSWAPSPTARGGVGANDNVFSGRLLTPTPTNIEILFALICRFFRRPHPSHRRCITIIVCFSCGVPPSRCDSVTVRLWNSAGVPFTTSPPLRYPTGEGVEAF